MHVLIGLHWNKMQTTSGTWKCMMVNLQGQAPPGHLQQIRRLQVAALRTNYMVKKYGVADKHF